MERLDGAPLQQEHASSLGSTLSEDLVLGGGPDRRV